MPRCSHGVPFENKCHHCFSAAMSLYPDPPRMTTYPVQVALRQPQQPMAIHMVTDAELLEKEKV